MAALKLKLSVIKNKCTWMPITAQLKEKKRGKTSLKKQMHWDTAPYQAQQEEEGRACRVSAALENLRKTCNPTHDTGRILHEPNAPLTLPGRAKLAGD